MTNALLLVLEKELMSKEKIKILCFIVFLSFRQESVNSFPAAIR